jgi:signal transduction histidine kinase
VWVEVHRIAGQLSLSVRDDGAGVDQAVARAPAIVRARIGLLSMRERAAMAGGTLKVESTLARGTKVSAAFSV